MFKPNLPPNPKFKKKVFADAGAVAGFIYQIGESKKLRKPSWDVSVNKITSTQVQQEIRYLKGCLLKYRKLTGLGRAITAIQVGIPKRFAVIYKPQKLITIINPKITNISKEKYLYAEMCMSANPVVAPVIRPTWIEFEYYDENAELKKWKTKDKTKNGKILNRVFQHEIDHMNGIINIDLVKTPSDLFLLSDPKFYKTAKFEKIKSVKKPNISC